VERCCSVQGDGTVIEGQAAITLSGCKEVAPRVEKQELPEGAMSGSAPPGQICVQSGTPTAAIVVEIHLAPASFLASQPPLDSIPYRTSIESLSTLHDSGSPYWRLPRHIDSESKSCSINPLDESHSMRYFSS
jgi:hypothetical protein